MAVLYVYIVYYRDCLHDHIMAFGYADVQCPYEELGCKGMITKWEMKAVCLCLVLVYPLVFIICAYVCHCAVVFVVFSVCAYLLSVHV